MKTHQSIFYAARAVVCAIAFFLVPVAVSAQNAPNPEAQKLKDMIAALANAQYPQDLVARDWASLWNPSFDQPWTPKLPGQSLSQLLDDLVTKKEHPFHRILKNGEENWTQDSSQKNSAMGLHVLCGAIFADAPAVNPNAPGQFPALLAARQDEMPVTHGDVLTCRIVEDTLFLSQTHPTLPSDQTAAWVHLAQARNPVYRLIAVRGFGYFTTTSDQAQTFYSSMTGETEPAINRTLVQNLSGRTDQWAVALLPQIKAKLPTPSR